MAERLSRFERSVAINYASGDQILTAPGTGLYISSAGNLVVRLRCGTSDTTLTGLLAGKTYDFEVVAIRQTNSTAQGQILY
jgi:hypothetical protein